MADANPLAPLSAGWAKGVFHPVYLFAGPDVLQKEEAVNLLRKHFLKGDEGLNLDRFDGDSSSAGEILTAYQTLPFLGGGRLVIVRRADALSPADANRLAETLETPPGGNCLVLLWDDKPDGRSALCRAAKSAGKDVVFWIPFEDQLPRWIADRARAAGKSITPDAARTLLEAVGPNLSDLSQEIEKLVLYVKDAPSIAEADVDALSGGNRTLQFMEWDRALWARDRAKVLELLHVMKAQGQAPESLLSQTGRAVQKLLMGKALAADKSITRQEMWERLWIRLRSPQQAFEQALTVSGWDDLLEALEALVKAESDVKTGRMDADTALTLLLCKLTQGAQ